MPASNRDIDRLLTQYALCHRHPRNEAIHCVCIPLIVFSLLGLLWSVHPALALGCTLASLVYYVRLSRAMALGMTLMAGLSLALCALLPSAWLGSVSLLVFVLAWVGQFIGHKIEGKKPAFFDDLRFLLIGPLFVLGVLYRRLNITY